MNSTNFLKKQNNQSNEYFLIDWECAGLNYPGYDIANYFNEMNWDYSYD